MVKWLSTQNTLGTGQFSRTKPDINAKLAYSRLQCPGALLWIAEALGKEKEIVQKAAIAAASEPNKKCRSVIIREHIPWSNILKLSMEQK